MRLDLYVILERLRLFRFRNHAETVLAPSSGLNMIEGDNGAGKTALLEAAYLLSSARSFRTRVDSELAQWGEQAARIEGEFRTDAGHLRRLALQWERKDGVWVKQASLQGDTTARLADFLGTVPCSLFTPEDRALISGPPALRRRYLDLQLSKRSPLHLHELAKLKRVLASRNALLKSRRSDRELLPWNRLLFELTQSIGARRREATEFLAEQSAALLERLTDRKRALLLRYRASWPEDWAEFELRLTELKDRERALGQTLLSPHKDELEIQLDGRPLRQYGSLGQQRLVALALRLAEAEHLVERTQERPILLLDDALSELDAAHRARLLTYLAEQRQVLMTATDLDPDEGPTQSRHLVRDGALAPPRNTLEQDR